MAKQMQGLLRSVVRAAPAADASSAREEGGKTGTTTKGRDLVYGGYEPRAPLGMGISGWAMTQKTKPTLLQRLAAAPM